MAQKPPPRQPSRALVRTRQPIVPTKPGADKLDLSQFPEIAVLERNLALLEYAFSKMEPGIDYGTVPGIKKPFLKIPGTERLQQMFTLRLKLEDKDFSQPAEDFYRHQIFARAYRRDLETGEEIYLGMGIGVCSSRESRYRYRWFKAEDIPSNMKVGMEATYQATNRNTGEVFTKQTIDMQKWIDVYGVGTAKMTQYGARFRLLNPDIADLDNTVAKQAAKRARADVVQNVTGAHRMFAREEDLENAGVDSTVASRYDEQASDEDIPLDELEDSPAAPKVTAAPAPPPTAKSTTRTQTGGEPAPAPGHLSAPTAVKAQSHLCPLHPKMEFREYPTRAGGKVWAHKTGTGTDGKPTWCFEDEVLQQQGAGPDDMDAVNVKDDGEFLSVIKQLQEKLGYDDAELKKFLENNYPTSGTDVANLPVAVRRPLLKDLNALLKSGVQSKGGLSKLFHR